MRGGWLGRMTGNEPGHRCGRTPNREGTESGAAVLSQAYALRLRARGVGGIPRQRRRCRSPRRRWVAWKLCVGRGQNADAHSLPAAVWPIVEVRVTSDSGQPTRDSIPADGPTSHRGSQSMDGIIQRIQTRQDLRYRDPGSGLAAWTEGGAEGGTDSRYLVHTALTQPRLADRS